MSQLSFKTPASMKTSEDLKMSRKFISRLTKALLNLALTVTLLYINCLLLSAQPTAEELDVNENHELTIYIIKSASPLNWESPDKLYKTYRNSVLINFLKKERTLKGHFFISLRTSLLDDPLYAGITSVDRKEEKKLMFINKVGLSVFGLSMKGTIQGRDVLLKKIDIHKKTGDIAYIKINLSKSAAQRVIDFYNIYSTDFIPNYSQSDFYGGAYWPLYENEGAACSSFAIAILDLIHIKEFETDKWQKPINIPMDLIGGELNNSKKIKVRDIKKTKSWHDGNGVENIDFVPFSLCDPSTAYYWIIEQQDTANHTRNEAYIPDSESGIPGLFIDKSNVEIDSAKPIITKRPDKNFFVEYHHTNLAKKITK